MQKILIIDDEMDMLFLLQSILETKGYIIETNNSGDLVKMVENISYPDLILLDLKIGEKNGGEICAELKSDQRTKHIPIILVSGEREIEQVKEKCGADDYLSKPFRFNDLIYKVEMMLQTA